MAFEQCSVRVFPTVLELAASLGGYTLELANAAIDSRGRFNIAISGGSVVEVRACCGQPCTRGPVRHPAVAASCGCFLWSCLFCIVSCLPRWLQPTVQFLAKGLRDVSETSEGVRLDKWHFFFVDERCVPLTHADSNYHAAMAQLFLAVRVRLAGKVACSLLESVFRVVL